jgi:hypothetical protein
MSPSRRRETLVLQHAMDVRLVDRMAEKAVA